MPGIGFPRAGTPIADPTGQPNKVWSRLFTRITSLLNTIGVTLAGTHADRLALDLTTLTDGTVFFEEDRGSFYVALGGVWTYSTGTMVATKAAAPVDLGAGDAGFLLEVTDFGHLVKWTGTAWAFAPGDDGPGRLQDFVMAPPGIGWQLCDGSVVTYLTVGAALGTANFTTPALTSSPAYKKSGAAYTGVINAAGNTAVDTGAGIAVQAGTGTTVAAHTHVHVEGDPANLVVLSYFRR